MDQWLEYFHLIFNFFHVFPFLKLLTVSLLTPANDAVIVFQFSSVCLEDFCHHKINMKSFDKHPEKQSQEEIEYQQCNCCTKSL